MDDAAKCAYLAAFIDGEGHIGVHPQKSGHPTRTIYFNNTDKQLFDAVVQITIDLGFRFRTYDRPGQKEGWSHQWSARLAGPKEAFERFERIIPLQAERKRKALSDIIASYIDPEVIRQNAAAKRVRVTVHCQHCGKAFEAWPSYVLRGGAKFCSQSCGAQHRNRPRVERVTRHCEQCGVQYVVLATRGPSRFCSASCRGIAQRDRMRGLAKAAAEARWKDHRAS